MKEHAKKVVRVGSLGNLPLNDELDAIHTKKHTTGDVSFTDSDIDRFLDVKKRRNLDEKSIFWIRRIMGILKDATGGVISKESMDRVRDTCMDIYTSNPSRSKCRSYIKEFLGFMGRTDFVRSDLWTKYQNYFDIERDRSKAHHNTRVITTEDIRRVLDACGDEHNRAYLMLCAYSGQRVNNVERRRTTQHTDEVLHGSRQVSSLSVQVVRTNDRPPHRPPPLWRKVLLSRTIYLVRWTSLAGVVFAVPVR